MHLPDYLVNLFLIQDTSRYPLGSSWRRRPAAGFPVKVRSKTPGLGLKLSRKRPLIARRRLIRILNFSVTLRNTHPLRGSETCGAVRGNVIHVKSRLDTDSEKPATVLFRRVRDMASVFSMRFGETSPLSAIVYSLVGRPRWFIPGCHLARHPARWQLPWCQGITSPPK
jgi:hypothetical protein